ncbi:MAG: sulfotransferase [Chloroflexota bacterium]
MRDESIPSDMRSPIFIGGMHRSGTSLIQTLLNRHPHIASGPESRFLKSETFLEFHSYLEALWMHRLDSYGFGRGELDRAVASILDTFFTRYQLQKGKQRWAEKTTKNILRIDYLFRLFPQAQFVHMIRDPRDVHCSVRTRASGRAPHWARFSAIDTARDWVRRTEHGLQWRAQPLRYLEILYEQLVQQPASTMQLVLRFLDEPWTRTIFVPNQVTDAAHEANEPNVNQQVFSSSVGKWQQELPEEDVHGIEQIAGSLMTLLGYKTVSLTDVEIEEPNTPRGQGGD